MEAVGLFNLDVRYDLIWAFESWSRCAVGIYARVNLDRFYSINTAKGRWALIEGLQHVDPPGRDTASDDSLSLPPKPLAPVNGNASSAVVQAQQELQLGSVSRIVHDLTVEILGEQQLTSNGEFVPGSFDSISAVELSNSIGQALDLKLPASLVYDYPSVPAVARFLVSRLTGATTRAPTAPNRHDSLSIVSTRPEQLRLTVAQSCPGTSRAEADWPNSLTGPDAISLVPYGRWDLDRYKVWHAADAQQSPCINLRARHAVERVRLSCCRAVWRHSSHTALEDSFTVWSCLTRLCLAYRPWKRSSWTLNSGFCSRCSEHVLPPPSSPRILCAALSPSIIRTYDLQVSHEAFQRALELGSAVPPSSTAVYVGIQQMEYGALAVAHLPALGGYSATSTPFSVASGRISFIYGFKGPALSIDTACSSAMVGAHAAVQQLTAGRSGAALAAGVNLVLAWRTTAAAQAAGMLAPDGRCKTLDSAADGYVRSESCIVLHILARPATGLPSLEGPGGDPSVGVGGQAVIQGTFVNQDGRSSSLTAPNGPSQQAVIFGALQAAGIQPVQVVALELHGTGTPLGDPIEIGAALSVLQDGARPLRLSAAKSRMGHAEAAAGSVGIVSAVRHLIRQHSCFIPTLATVNPYIQTILADVWTATRGQLYLPRQAGSRLASRRPPGASTQLATGISAFAFQGTNAHTIVTQIDDPDPRFQGGSLAPVSDATFSRQWYWFMPTCLRLLDRCTVASSGAVVLQCAHDSPALVFLRDHRVRGRELLPAAAMLDMALGAGQVAADQAARGVDVWRQLGSCAFTSPFITGSSAKLICSVEPSSGALLLQSSSGTSVTTHMHAESGKAWWSVRTGPPK